MDKRKDKKGVLGYFNYINQIKQLNLDMVIHCYFEPYYAYLMLCAGVPIRIGDSQKIGLRPTVNYPSPMNVMNLLNHEVDLNISLLKYYYLI